MAVTARVYSRDSEYLSVRVSLSTRLLIGESTEVIPRLSLRSTSTGKPEVALGLTHAMKLFGAIAGAYALDLPLPTSRERSVVVHAKLRFIL
jgi:hypothetical protein